MTQSYLDRTPQSAHLARQARELFPGGVSGHINFLDPYPPTMRRASGAHLWDVDDNRYIDFLLAWGTLLLGHGHPAVRQAIIDQMTEDGTLIFGAPHQREADLARAVLRHFPSARRLRFTNSGLEATLLSLRLAIAFTGRPRVAKFEGQYHGAHDRVLVSYASAAGPAEQPASVPDSLGLAATVLDDTVVLPWNDWENTERIIRSRVGELAAVIAEPIQGGYIPPRPGFLERLRQLTADLDIPLIFDEIKTGLRVGLGGAQARFGIDPDLTALGKTLGGGLPIGAVLGRADILHLARPGSGSETVFHSGTFNGHPTVMAAGLAVISELERPDVYSRLEALADDLKKRIGAAARRRGLTLTTPGVGPVFGIVFADHQPLLDPNRS